MLHEMPAGGATQVATTVNDADRITIQMNAKMPEMSGTTRGEGTRSRRGPILLAAVSAVLLAVVLPHAQQSVTELRDPGQQQDEDFAKLYKQWTGDAKYGSPLVDHLPLAKGIPTPKDVLGHHVGAPRQLTYYADILKFYRALAAATPRVKVETIGKSDEGRELVVVWVSSESNIRALQQNRDNLAKLADPRGLSEQQVRELVATTKPHYHAIGGLHSGETGPSEMLMELVYRVAVETSPFISQIRNNVYFSVTPVADADGRDRWVDWFYRGLEASPSSSPPPPTAPAEGVPPNQQAAPGAQGGQGRGTTTEGTAQGGEGAGRGRGSATMGVPYWGKYVYHDNNRDINIALVQMRALTDWYYTAHPPVMHDLHESMPLMYTYSGGPPQNPNLDPLLFFELPWFSNWEVAQMTKWGMPGVYTHAFMDGWSPGYLGSVSYNHNGLMKMYETQSGRDAPVPTTTTAAPPTRGTPPSRTASGETGRGRGGDQAQATTPPAKPAAPPTTSAATQGTGTTASQPGAAGAAPGSQPAQPAGAQTPVAGGTPPAGGGRGTPFPTGRGGSQEREWYRGLPVPSNAAASFSRRNNVNYSQTGVLLSLQLTAMFPNVVVENFYIKTRNSIEEGKTKPPYGFVIPVQRDMTRATELVRVLRVQGIEVGQATREFKLGDATFPAGSYVVKRDQPYGRLAKNLLEKQVYPDTRLNTYDDSGWTMGLAMRVEVKEIADQAILKLQTTPVRTAGVKGTVAGSGTAGLAVAHYGSNNMIAFRYRLKALPMKIAEKGFKAGSVEMPAGSFVLTGTDAAAARAAVEDLGLTAVALEAMPQVPMHDAPAPRIAIYSQWTTTQELGWYRLTFDNFGVPYDLIYKEQVKQGDLRRKYDVIVMAAQNLNRDTVFQLPAPRPQPYQRSDKYRFLGMYGETPDMSGGFGQQGVDEFAKFLEGGGTLIAALTATRFPIEFGWTRTVDVQPIVGVTAQRPIVEAEIARPEHPVFYGYSEKVLPVKYAGPTAFRVGVADQGNVLARYVGGDSSVMTGAMVGADQLKQRVFAVDVPNAHNGKGRVLLFANNPIYRWQNHGEFNLVFNSLLNWNYVPKQ